MKTKYLILQREFSRALLKLSINRESPSSKFLAAKTFAMCSTILKEKLVSRLWLLTISWLDATSLECQSSKTSKSRVWCACSTKKSSQTQSAWASCRRWWQTSELSLALKAKFKKKRLTLFKNLKSEPKTEAYRLKRKKAKLSRRQTRKKRKSKLSSTYSTQTLKFFPWWKTSYSNRLLMKLLRKCKNAPTPSQSSQKINKTKWMPFKNQIS